MLNFEILVVFYEIIIFIYMNIPSMTRFMSFFFIILFTSFYCFFLKAEIREVALVDDRVLAHK